MPRLGPLVKRPQDRVEAIRKVVENLGGEIEALVAGWNTTWRSSPRHAGQCQRRCILRGRRSRWSVQECEATPLLSIAEGLEAMKKAGSWGYKPRLSPKVVSPVRLDLRPLPAAHRRFGVSGFESWLRSARTLATLSVLNPRGHAW